MRRLSLLVPLALAGSLLAPAAAEPVRAHAVVALIDTGINPYSLAFRDDSALAQQHPSTYLPGYPPECDDEGTVVPCSRRLDLALDAATFEDAFEVDRGLWENLVFPNTLYWIPGTKIVGAISVGRGGTDCDNGAPAIPPVGGQLRGFFCAEHTILDDQGHGTMTSSRATAVANSLGADARVVMIEGLGEFGVTWAADQGWIDVQSNSWGSLVSTPTGSIPIAFKRAAEKHLVLTASGNGLGFSGVAPTPTHIQPTMPQGVLIVGAHDNGRVAAWSGAPAHVVTDGYGGYAARKDSMALPEPLTGACCSSASSPYAAGAAAAIALEARRILSDISVGVHDGVVASGPSGLVPAGPLSDGTFTLEEWRGLVLATAEDRPGEGRDDGLLHFTGGPGVPAHPEHGSGENPFCQFCWTLPIPWTDVPAEVPAYLSIGYGALNERSVALAAAVLAGEQDLQARPVEDEFYAQDQELRRALFGA